VARPALRGTLLALAAALAFGLTTPLVQRLGKTSGPFTTAALLYAGAALVGVAMRSSREAAPKRMHTTRIVAVAILGAGIAPVLLAWGLARTSGTAASLMLNLEAVFTIVLARLLWGEHVGRRVATAAMLLVVGGALLVVDRHEGQGSGSLVGLLAIAGASLAWAGDNALAKPLSALDPARIVAWKGALGASLAACVALATRETAPPIASALGLLLIGATGYGLSLRLYLLAQRALGAGRTASVFAFAPFCGALLAAALGEPAGTFAIAGGAAMLLGVVLHLGEQHEHPHVHDAHVHEHAHRHDDGHHDHAHDPMPDGEHTHPHEHPRTEHTHAHVPDLHHGHDHD
jgi:drug/metabolite transporter (DMT)-like permease